MQPHRWNHRGTAPGRPSWSTSAVAAVALEAHETARAEDSDDNSDYQTQMNKTFSRGDSECSLPPTPLQDSVELGSKATSVFESEGIRGEHRMAHPVFVPKIRGFHRQDSSRPHDNSLFGHLHGSVRPGAQPMSPREETQQLHCHWDCLAPELPLHSHMPPAPPQDTFDICIEPRPDEQWGLSTEDSQKQSGQFGIWEPSEPWISKSYHSASPQDVQLEDSGLACTAQRQDHYQSAPPMQGFHQSADARRDFYESATAFTPDRATAQTVPKSQTAERVALYETARGFASELSGTQTFGSMAQVSQASPKALATGKPKRRQRQCCCKISNSLCSSIKAVFMVLSLAAICVFAFIIWMLRAPVMGEGAFGLLIQTSGRQDVDFYLLSKAREHAVAGLHAMRAGALNSSWSWHHIELIFELAAGGILTEYRMLQALRLEMRLRSLPGWQHLCNEKVPDDQRYYCEPGDSLPALVFSSKKDANETSAGLGVLNEVTFDGGGATGFMAISSLLTYLRSDHSKSFKRWLGNREGSTQDRLLRTQFSFYLDNADIPLWNTFTQDELEPVLFKLEEESDTPVSEEEEGRLRIFHRVSGLESKEFERASRHDLLCSWFAPIAASVGTLLATRRVLLAIASAILGLVAPTIASAVAASHEVHTEQHGRLGYPAVAVASWFLIVVNCTDLAIASECAWLGQGATVKPQRGCVHRQWPFLAEVCAPMFGAISTLLISSWQADLPLLKEFSSHAALGMAVALLLAPLVYAPALAFEDHLYEVWDTSASAERVRETILGTVPFERLGTSTSIASKGSASANSSAHTFQGRSARCMSFLVVLVVIVAISLPKSSLAYSGSSPQLFSSEHRVTMGHQIRSSFGVAVLPGPSEPPVSTQQSARTCRPDAHEGLGCSWYRCDVQRLERTNNTCSCHKQVQGKWSQECGSAARIVGFNGTLSSLTNGSFWPWTQTFLGAPLNNTINDSTSVLNMGSVQMEDWLTGTVTMEPLMGLKRPRKDGTVPAWEDACLQLICYCGPFDCKIEKWTTLGNYHASSPRRQLFGGSGVRRMQAVESQTVFIVWGLLQRNESPSRDVNTVHHFDPYFNITSIWEQRSVLNFCKGPDPALAVISRACWAMDFKKWLAVQGERFPVRSEDFYDRFHRFTAETYSDLVSGSPPVSKESSSSYFWFTPSGTMQGFYMSFMVSAPTGSREVRLEYMRQWEEYLGKRKIVRWTGSWLTSERFADLESEETMRDAARIIAVSGLVCTMIVTFLLTWSPGLTLANIGVLALDLGCLLGIRVWFGNGPIGIQEVMALAAFLTILITPVIRTSQHYVIAKDVYEDPGSGAPHSGGPQGNAGRVSPRIGRATVLSDSPQRRGAEQDLSAVPPLLRSHSQIMEAGVKPYLVDNRKLQAKSKGLGYRRSPNLEDFEKNSDIHECMAPWGSVVSGAAWGDKWLKVKDRFLPTKLLGVPVLSAQDMLSSEEMPELLLDHAFSSGSPLCSSHQSNQHSDEQLRPGAVLAERLLRVTRALKGSTKVVMGSSVTGILISGGFWLLHMQALRKIGLNMLIGALTMLPTILGLLPVLLLLGLAPTQARRLACIELRHFLRGGFPLRSRWRAWLEEGGTDAEHEAYAPLAQKTSELDGPHASLRPQQLGSSLLSSQTFDPSAYRLQTAVAAKYRETPESSAAGLRKGEVVALVLGFPFSCSVRKRRANFKDADTVVNTVVDQDLPARTATATSAASEPSEHLVPVEAPLWSLPMSITDTQRSPNRSPPKSRETSRSTPKTMECTPEGHVLL